jgi:hypothetical protein
MLTLEIPSVVLLVFVSVTVCVADGVFTVWLPKLNVGGVSVTVGMAAVPVPLSVAVCGDPVASSATDTVAPKLVADPGVNVTEIVHVALAASVAPHVVVFAKSDGFAPTIVMPEMFIVELPVFVSVST